MIAFLPAPGDFLVAVFSGDVFEREIDATLIVNVFDDGLCGIA
jgi:hypothetical protein